MDPGSGTPSMVRKAWLLSRPVPAQPPTARRGAGLVAAGFAGLIFTGTILLVLPVSTASGQAAPLGTALFTSTSAVCVTGLVVVDTGTYWSPFGHAVIYLLMQLGGIGFGVSATFLFWLLGRNIGLSERLQLSALFPGTAAHRIVRMSIFIIALSLGIQALGALLLFTQWVGRFSFDQAIFFSIFHSAAAFCNAGFDIFGSAGYPGVSMGLDRHNVVVTGAMAMLVALGGLGFPVLAEVGSRFLRRRKVRDPERILRGRPVAPSLSLHARLALLAHFGLFAVSIPLLWLLEFRNSTSLATEPLGNQLIDAVNLSVNPRTAGFATFPLAALQPTSLLAILVLMFIGTASAGTGGGVKVNTVAALFASVAATVAGRPRPQIFKRTLTQESINKALAIVLIVPSAITLGIFFLSLTESHIPIDQLVFEAVSAFSTVGLSLDVTPRLSEWGRIIVDLLMFVGRLGPLTLVVLLSAREHPPLVTYAEEPVLVG